jgi:curved DNA-binding protein
VEQILNEEDYYKILGISRDEVRTSKHADRVIQKAYRKRAVHTHPDKTGGDRRAFDKVAEAYDVLQDKEKRALYDRFGKDGMKQQQQQQQPNFGSTGGGMSAEDLFRSFFGSSGFGGSTFGGTSTGGFGRQRRMRQYILDVSLEELYMGATKNVQLPEGETIECQIPRGMRDGTALTVETDQGESVVLIVRPRQHHVFTKQGFDLIVTLRISLTEAITGVSRQIRLLDGSSLWIASAGNDDNDDDNSNPAVIETGDVQVLKGYGMPKGEGSFSEKGNLYIQYEVVRTKRKRGDPTTSSATTLSPEEMMQLKRLLSKLEGRLFNDSTSNLDKSNMWPFKSRHKKVKRLQKASPEDIQPKTRPNPFETGGFPFGAGFSSSFGSGGMFFSGF